MPTYEKDGKKHFHPNPQVAKMHSHAGESPREEKLEESISPGIHKKVEEAERKGLAHHVEVHHGPHEHGEPPAHEGHTHHTITHHHDGAEPEIRNHEHYDEAEGHMRQMMHGEEENMMEGEGHEGEGETDGEGY